MKLLFICSTEFQLFNVLNMKMHLFPNDSADIIIQFLKEDTVEFYNRVCETGIFENVCYRLPDVFGLHEYARCVRKGDYSHSLVGAANNSMKEFFTNLSSRTSHEFIDNVKDCVYNVESLDFSSYQAVFAGGTNDIVTNIIRHLHSNNPKCKINIYEEGVGSYINDILGDHCEDIPRDNIYLYEPTMPVYKHPSLRPIPKVKRDDLSFLEIANRIFSYVPQTNRIEGQIIYLDDPSEPLPNYLQYSNLLNRTLFVVPYKRHLRDHEIYLRQLAIYKLLLENVGTRKILVKLHPRNERLNILQEYQGPNTKIFENISVPWELFCCNCELRNNIFVTMESSSISANSLVVDGHGENVLIICRQVDNERARHDKYNEFHVKLKQKGNSKEVYMPKSKKEYVSILRDVLGRID